MRIVAIHETTVPIRSNIRNAYIDFSAMTEGLKGSDPEVGGCVFKKYNAELCRAARDTAGNSALSPASARTTC